MAAALRLGAWQVVGGQGQAVAQQSSELSQQVEAQSADPAALTAAMENGAKATTKVMAITATSLMKLNVRLRGRLSIAPLAIL
jgi:hypothetical protein